MASLAEVLAPELAALSELAHLQPTDVQRVVALAYQRLASVVGLAGRPGVEVLASTGGFGRCQCGAIWLVVDMVHADDGALACVTCPAQAGTE